MAELDSCDNCGARVGKCPDFWTGDERPLCAPCAALPHFAAFPRIMPKDPAPCRFCRPVTFPVVGRDCSGSVTWVACPRCEDETDDLKAWAARHVQPAAPRAPSAPAALLGDALNAYLGSDRVVDDLAGRVAAIRDSLTARIVADWPVPETVRALADDLDALADAATDAARALYDAAPDQVAVPDCPPACRGTGFLDYCHLAIDPCPVCNAPAA